MNNQVTFIQHDKPGLENGTYSVTLRQSVKKINKNKDVVFNQSSTFRVKGEQFQVPDSWIHAQFPPLGTEGKYTDSLPHISLTRSSFPWERSAYPGEKTEPWLALLLVTEAEIQSGKVRIKKVPGNELSALLEQTIDASDLPVSATVLSVQKRFLEALIPDGRELELLVHTRKKVHGDEQIPDTEIAVIVGSRLPKAGSSHQVHLVSVEGQYISKVAGFNFSGKGDTDFISLVSLVSWEFSCPGKEGRTFEETLNSLDVALLKTPASPSLDKKIKHYLDYGFCLLPHSLRNGAKSYSWYHGPFSPSPLSTRLSATSLPDFGDKLIDYHQGTGLMDLSYSMAYSLGQLLALQDEQFAKALYQWKFQYNKIVNTKKEAAYRKQLLGKTSPDSFGKQLGDEAEDLETIIRTWMHNTAILLGVPFNYLLPDETLLPKESLRFFCMDKYWIDCLLFGAFRVGGSLLPQKNTELENQEEIWQIFQNFCPSFVSSEGAIQSGFLLRSQLVSGWPDLMVDAYPARIPEGENSSKHTPFPVLRMERLGSETLFVLIEGHLSTAEIYLSPEGLNFGLDESDDRRKLSKDINLNVAGTTNVVKETVRDVSFKSGREAARIIDIHQLATQITQTVIDAKAKNSNIDAKTDHFCSAHFGMYMLEGASKGRFLL